MIIHLFLKLSLSVSLSLSLSLFLLTLKGVTSGPRVMRLDTDVRVEHINKSQWVSGGRSYVTEDVPSGDLTLPRTHMPLLTRTRHLYLDSYVHLHAR